MQKGALIKTEDQSSAQVVDWNTYSVTGMKDSVKMLSVGIKLKGGNVKEEWVN